MSAVLPIALMILMLASPVFSAPTSPNDLFRAIALRVPPKAEPLICCLKPLPPLDTVEEDVLLSFEEWKAKQSEIQAQEIQRAKEKDGVNRSGHAQGGGNNGASGLGGGTGNDSEVIPLTPDNHISSDPTSSSSLEDPEKAIEALSPHFRVPLTDRFNYASLDCSARVHTSHRSAKSASSILSSKRDRYMLSPCRSSKQEMQFVVVELCEDIRIDTVQLANFEFFSGVFKDFTVSVAKTYTTDADGWTIAGSYKAKNVRGVQSFHPPTSLRDFYRYIRIDFHSHYANEYYCPVSLLRVYGLTHLEHWKWDIWEAESRAKLAQSIVDLPTQSPEVIEDNRLSDLSNETTLGSVQILSDASETPYAKPTADGSSNPSKSFADSSDKQTTAQADIPTLPIADGEIPHPATSASSVQDTKDTSLQPPISATPQHQTIPFNDLNEISSTKFHPPTSSSSSSVTSSKISPSSMIRDIIEASPSSSWKWRQTTVTSSSSSSSGTPTNSSTTRVAVSSRGPPSSSYSSTTSAIIIPSVIITNPVVPPPTGGESIYRTIMNRLTALESNHTLYVRYVEQQTNGVREVLRRLGEEVGRLEGIGRAQTLTYQRSAQEWERQRYQLQMEYGELMSRVDYLSEEIILEKRLGIAQLCLLLAVLVFIGLTRGSRGESFMYHGPVKFNKSVREWGKRHLSFSADWRNRFKSKSRSPSPRRELKTKSPRPLPLDLSEENSKIQFPTKGDPWIKSEPEGASDINGYPKPHRDARSRTMSRSRTPSLRTPVSRYFTQHQHLSTPTASASRPRIQRSNSGGAAHVHGGIWSGSAMAAPRSAKRWARTAHLHEVRAVHLATAKARHADEAVDVFTSPRQFTINGYDMSGTRSADILDTCKRKGRALEKYPDKVVQIAKSEDAESDLWVDSDFSVDESESGLELDMG